MKNKQVGQKFESSRIHVQYKCNGGYTYKKNLAFNNIPVYHNITYMIFVQTYIFVGMLYTICWYKHIFAF